MRPLHLAASAVAIGAVASGCLGDRPTPLSDGSAGAKGGAAGLGGAGSSGAGASGAGIGGSALGGTAGAQGGVAGGGAAGVGGGPCEATVGSVTPTTAKVGVETTFSIDGTCLPKTLTASLGNCTTGDQSTTGNDTTRTFVCKVTGVPEKRSGTVRDSVAGNVVGTFQVDVTASTCAISDVVGDCQRPTCDAAGDLVMAPDDDPPNKACTVSVCSNGKLEETPAAYGTPCGATSSSYHCDGAGKCGPRPSCVGHLATTCGTDATKSGSCCDAAYVAGGTFAQDWYEGGPTTKAHSAQLSPFFLDRFEVTHARFRQFVAAYDSGAFQLKDGAGGDPTLTDLASGAKAAKGGGWDASWGWGTRDATMPNPDQYLPPPGQLKAFLSTNQGLSWLDVDEPVNPPGTSPAYFAVNYVTWYQAMAFCIYDGGRLPTNAEWNFAAAAGSQQLPYPWAASSADTTYAPGWAALQTSEGGVGLSSKDWTPLGIADLAGNVREWLRDQSPATNVYAPSGLCVDCVDLTDPYRRDYRGASIYHDATVALVTNQTSGAAPYGFITEIGADIGFRCARR